MEGAVLDALIRLFVLLKPYHRLLTAIIVLSSLILAPLQRSVFAFGAECYNGSPISGAYLVTVCIESPVDGAAVSGNTSVTVTVHVDGTNPGSQKLLFYLDGQYLLTDYASPYMFVIPTTKFVEGARLLEAEVYMRDGFVSSRGAINVTFTNGITEPTVNTNTYTAATGTTPQPSRHFTLAVTGDGVTAASGPFGASAWTSVDITPLITGNGSFNIALTTTNTTAFSLANRETGANAP